MKRPELRANCRYVLDWQLLALHLIYYALLLWVYITYIVDIFGYAGFVDEFNIRKAIFSPFVITLSFLLLRNNGLPSYFFLNIIIALTVTTSLVIFSGSNLPILFMAVTWVAFTILAIVARFFRLPLIRSKKIGNKVLLGWLAGISLLFIASIFAFGGGAYLNFDLTRVSEFRREAAANLPGIFGYLMPNVSKAIMPLGIVLSLIYRKWVFLILFICCAIMIFALSSHKSPLFMPIVIISVYWFSHYKKALDLTLLALIAVVLIGGIDFYLWQSGIGGLSGLFGNLFVRRALLVPSLLNWAYFDFFSVNPYTYWADSKLSLGIIDNPYDLGIAKLIGREFMGNEETNANTGWIGSGMANAGYVGIALYSVLIGLLLSLADAFAKKLGYAIVLAIFILIVMGATQSTDFTTMLLTHGVFASILIVMLLQPIQKGMRDSGKLSRSGKTGQ